MNIGHITENQLVSKIKENNEITSVLNTIRPQIMEILNSYGGKKMVNKTNTLVKGCNLKELEGEIGDYRIRFIISYDYIYMMLVYKDTTRKSKEVSICRLENGVISNVFEIGTHYTIIDEKVALIALNEAKELQKQVNEKLKGIESLIS